MLIVTNIVLRTSRKPLIEGWECAENTCGKTPKLAGAIYVLREDKHLILFRGPDLAGKCGHIHPPLM